MTNELAIAMPSVPTLGEIEALKEICRVAAMSNFLSSTAKDPGQRGADAFFVVMYGRELGIPPMTALRTIHVIDGKPTCSGQALLSLMLRAGVRVELPNPGTVTDSATVKIQRPGGIEKSYTYTDAMAKEAGLSGKTNWNKYKREMLMWRAISTAARFEVPDIVGGLYTIEEIAPDISVDADGEIVRVIQAKVKDVTPPLPNGDPVEADDETEHADDLTEMNLVNGIVKQKSTDSHPYIVFGTQETIPVITFTREPFRERGYSVNGWDEPGTVIEFSKPLPAKVKQNGDYHNLVDVAEEASYTLQGGKITIERP